MEDLPRLLERLQRDDIVVQPRRLGILILLALEGRLSFKELQDSLHLSPGNLGSHIQVLEKEGLVTRTRCLKGLRYVTCYELTEKGLERLTFILEITSKLSKLMK